MKGTIILVIGESVNRNHMQAFNPSYQYNTTPWENAFLKRNDVIAFPNTYSYYPNTIMAVTKALLNTSQYNGKNLVDSVSILNTANAAGYKTYWISAQHAGGIHDASISKIASYANIVKWVKGPDENVIKELDGINPQEPSFVVIHLMGSHEKYDKRYPSDFKDKIDSPNADYDTSISYTDSVLHRIFDYSTTHLNLLSMIYTADHGENMEYGHTTSPVKEDMLSIPLWIYLSPQYMSYNANSLPTLKSHQEDFVTNDTLYDTLVGLLQINCNYYTPAGDLFSPYYKNDTPVSMDGKIVWKH